MHKISYKIEEQPDGQKVVVRTLQPDVVLQKKTIKDLEDDKKDLLHKKKLYLDEIALVDEQLAEIDSELKLFV